MVSAKDAIVYSQGNEEKNVKCWISRIESYIDAAISDGYTTCVVDIDRGIPQSMRDKIKEGLNSFGYFVFIPKYDPVDHFACGHLYQTIMITWEKEATKRMMKWWKSQSRYAE